MKGIAEFIFVGVHIASTVVAALFIRDGAGRLQDFIVFSDAEMICGRLDHATSRETAYKLHGSSVRTIETSTLPNQYVHHALPTGTVDRPNLASVSQTRHCRAYVPRPVSTEKIAYLRAGMKSGLQAAAERGIPVSIGVHGPLTNSQRNGDSLPRFANQQRLMIARVSPPGGFI